LAEWAVLYPALYPASGSSGPVQPEHVWHHDEHQLDDLHGSLLDGTARVRVRVAAPIESSLGQILPIPLRSRGCDLGLLILGGPPREGFTAGVATLAANWRRGSRRLDNARLYSEQLDIVRALQRSLLPPCLPRCPAWTSAWSTKPPARGKGTDVGGDFYDVFPITSKAWDFAIGERLRAGPEAAALTGLARHSLRCWREREVGRLRGRTAEPGSAGGSHAGRGRRAFITLLTGRSTRPGRLGAAGWCARAPLPLVLRADGTVGRSHSAAAARASRTISPYSRVMNRPASPAACLPPACLFSRRPRRRRLPLSRQQAQRMPCESGERRGLRTGPQTSPIANPQAFDVIGKTS